MHTQSLLFSQFIRSNKTKECQFLREWKNNIKAFWRMESFKKTNFRITNHLFLSTKFVYTVENWMINVLVHKNFNGIDDWQTYFWEMLLNGLRNSVMFVKLVLLYYFDRFLNMWRNRILCCNESANQTY